MTPEMMIWVALLLPLVAIILIFLTGKSPNVRESCTLVIATVLFGVTCRLASYVFSGGRPELHLSEMMPGFEIAFKVD